MPTLTVVASEARVDMPLTTTEHEENTAKAALQIIQLWRQAVDDVEADFTLARNARCTALQDAVDALVLCDAIEAFNFKPVRAKVGGVWFKLVD